MSQGFLATNYQSNRISVFWQQSLSIHKEANKLEKIKRTSMQVQFEIKEFHGVALRLNNSTALFKKSQSWKLIGDPCYPTQKEHIIGSLSLSFITFKFDKENQNDLSQAYTMEGCRLMMAQKYKKACRGIVAILHRKNIMCSRQN